MQQDSTPATTPATRPVAKTLQERQKAYRERIKQKGRKRIPSGYMQPDVAQMVAQLINQGYASSINAVLHRAVRDAFSSAAAASQGTPD